MHCPEFYHFSKRKESKCRTIVLSDIPMLKYTPHQAGFNHACGGLCALSCWWTNDATPPVRHMVLMMWIFFVRLINFWGLAAAFAKRKHESFTTLKFHHAKCRLTMLRLLV